MANIEITNNTSRSIAVWDPVFESDTLTFTGAGTYAKGTILARDTSTLKLIAFVKGGTTNGNGIPVTVLSQAVEATAAGDVPVRPIVSGRVRKNDLVIDADGDSSNVDAAVVDQLRDYSIIAQDITQLAEFDNQ